MKPKIHSNFVAASLSAAFALAPAIIHSAALTWDGGGSDANWSTDANWVGDPATGPVNGDTLTFAGSTNLNANNDLSLSLNTGVAITFASGAGSFNLSGSALTLGSGGGGGQTIVSQQSANNQTISANINLSGGNGDRSIVFASGSGSLTLSGNIAFNGDWLFPNTTAGTIILSGTNTGDGKTTNAITAGTNIMRAMMRNNVAGTVLTLGSDGALGNSGTGDATLGTASLRGIVANQNLTINTIGNRNLSGSTLAINAGNITFNGASNLTIGNIVNQGGNRDFVVSSTGTVSVGTGVFLSGDQTGRRLFNNLSGAGGMIVGGKIHDTFHSGGITTNTTTSDAGATSTKSLYRKAGAGTLTLNGDSSTTFNGVMQVEAGTVKLGHSGALGASDGTAATATQLMGGTLDLNGQNIGEYVRVLSNSTLSNSSTTAASISANTDVVANLTVDATGDITATRLIGLSAARTIIKVGAGTLTTNGSSHNNLSTWDIQAGKVVFANTSGYGADRGVTLNGGTLQLSGSNSDLINNGQSFTINSGSFDLNGKGEAVASIGGSSGTITNSSTSAATLYVGGGVGGSSTATFGGTIQNGTGIMNLTKEGSGTQTLSGTNTYTGLTTISGGTLALSSTGSIDNTNGVSLGSGGTFDVSAKSGGYTVSNLTGAGNSIGSLTVSTLLSIGNSPGTTTFDDLTLGGSSTYFYELTGGDVTADLGVVDGNLTIDSGAILDLFQLGAYTPNDKFTLFAYTGSLTGTFSGLFDGATFSDAGGLWEIDYNDSSAGLNGGSGSSFVTITAVPEPASSLIGGLSFLLLFRRRR